MLSKEKQNCCNGHNHKHDYENGVCECGQRKEDRIQEIHEQTNNEVCCAKESDQIAKKEYESDGDDTGDPQRVDVKYKLQGLNCASCAGKIERNVNNLDSIINAKLNFATSILSLELKSNNLDDISKRITHIVKKLEPHVEVIQQGNESKIRVDDAKENSNSLLIRIGISVIFLVLAIFLKTSWNIALFGIAYLIIGADIVKRSFDNVINGEIFDENFLMTIATFAAIGIGEYPEAVMVMLLYQLGEYYQDRAVESSRKSIANLMDIRPDYANLKLEETINQVDPNEVSVGDIIIVKPGEKVPLDGVVIEGNTSVDAKALTGESVPVDIKPGESITSGSINIDGLITVKVTKKFSESAVSKILDLVQNASAKKAKTELRITKFARYYTPTVVVIAAITAIVPPIITGQEFSQWILRAATFLVVSCPCALVISIPMTYFAGLGASSKNGVLVKGGNYLEALSKAGVIIFDKTGTLTHGEFKVDNIVTNNISKEALLKLTAYVESFSTHPIAISIVNEYGKDIDKLIIKDYKETRGKGVEATIQGEHVISGNIHFLREKGLTIEDVESDGTIVYTAINSTYAGYIVIKDQMKEDSKTTIDQLKKLSIENIVMLTGDRKVTADIVAKQLGIHNYQYELLPDEKVDEVEKIISDKGEESLIFVGDGINDAPVLARADVGVAMGGVGSDAAIEAADVVIMNDEPSKLISAIKIARKTKKIANQNIFLSISIKVIIMIFAFFGYAPMWVAVFGDVGVSLLAVFNALRVLRNN